VPKKNLSRDIVPTLGNVVSVAQSSARLQRARECLSRAEMHFVLDNDPGLVPPLLGHLEECATSLQWCDRTDRLRVGMALHEAVTNAMYHGNLEVSSDLRQDDERIFHDLADRRRQQSPYRERRVHVRVSLSRHEAVYVVRDEGPGFNPAALPDPLDPANLGRVGGRGLVLIRTFMDRVIHNETGNEITLIKHRSQESGVRGEE
jgi:anti-sigma regulatory factor (Ser/Thr protein kinase)